MSTSTYFRRVSKRVIGLLEHCQRILEETEWIFEDLGEILEHGGHILEQEKDILENPNFIRTNKNILEQLRNILENSSPKLPPTKYPTKTIHYVRKTYINTVYFLTTFNLLSKIFTEKITFCILILF
ncbi:hypothetical protein JOC25_003123 [Solibacillus kalamii]|uniref:hypothetical protein n=1 Tax=Solibacillus kalamii TaxID=1748298 RepID=UPI0018763393|nr:hypothetical protein [Solibacillus kalamii]MBM7666613.1 hypothetical protein [Solibacillus kalamii]